ncbi:4Fe-4S ferredoxin N-terminal domain-containing protein [Halomicrobium salinisoli]|uniref:4Fe-4S ferredoxin N-terminal domain-containing protein n=1 Tax=Halomicrobium salinisoli TaxID=2878391 RepID=UPI001CF01611|nr:4Fe-4S ferredoxin N-terminal domain-containing protein [Halomicrobium salinisoli]
MPDDRPESFDEDRMEQLLADTEYDTELGLEMAQDAQRVASGELSEAEFFDRYHGDVLDEFGQDARELPELRDDLDGEVVADADDPDGIRDRLLDLADDEDVSRRELMKKGGAAAAALSAFAGGGAAAEDGPGGDTPTQGDGTRWGMVINLNNCDGCLACMAACSQEHGLSRGANWMYVFTYQDENHDDENFLVRPCQHCTDSPCTKVCPVGARHTREEDGLVLTDYDICIGCRYCEVSCPYGVNYFQWGEPDVPDSEIPDENQVDDRGKWVGARPPKGVMGKCTFCVDRQDGAMGEEKVGTTACEEACAMDAIHFGDLNDEESAPNQHLDQYRDAQDNDLEEFPNRTEHTVSTFQLMEERGTDPNVHYIGNEPSQDAEQVEGPVTYEDMGLADNRKEEVLDNGAMANKEGEQA